MIYVLHGENELKIEENLDLLKKSLADACEVLTLDALQTSAEVISSVFSNSGLFALKRLIIIRNFFSQKKFSPVDLIKRVLAEDTLIFVENRKLTIKQLAVFPKNAIIKLFKPDVYIFNFLDGLGINSSKDSLILLKKCLFIDRPEVILYHVSRRIRMLLAITTSDSCISEISEVASWQISKLKTQSVKIGQQKLLNFLNRLMEIEYNEKSGQSAISLAFALEQIIFI